MVKGNSIRKSIEVQKIIDHSRRSQGNAWGVVPNRKRGLQQEVDWCQLEKTQKHHAH